MWDSLPSSTAELELQVSALPGIGLESRTFADKPPASQLVASLLMSVGNRPIELRHGLVDSLQHASSRATLPC